MKVQIINNQITAFGNKLFGDNIFDAPNNYSPEIYDYTPTVTDLFDPNGFVLRNLLTIDYSSIESNENEMIDITITSDQISYIDSVLGLVSYQYNRETIEQVDSVSMHIETDKGVVLYNVLQYSFNGQSFTNTTEAIGYIDNL